MNSNLQHMNKYIWQTAEYLTGAFPDLHNWSSIACVVFGEPKLVLPMFNAEIVH